MPDPLHAALASCAALVLVGFSALTSALRRSPARPRPAVDTRTTRSPQGPLRAPGFAAMLLVVFASGCAIAVEEIAAIATWGRA